MYKTISMDTNTNTNYTYLMKNKANKELLMSDIIAANRTGIINILCYHVTNKSAKYPFIQIMLEKMPFIQGIIMDKFVLPFVTLSPNNLSTNVMNKVKNGLLELGCDPSPLDDNDAFIGLIDNNLLLVDISAVDIFRISIARQNQTWFALPTEIMNTQTICNIPIDNNVTNMFLTTPQLGMLHNPDNNTSVYPLPDAVYTGSHFKKVEFSSVFGMPKEQVYSSCSEYFYFYRIFEDAVKEGGWMKNYLQNDTTVINGTTNKLVDNEYGRYIRGGINRYALFPGNYFIHNENTNRFTLTDDDINGTLATKDSIVIQYTDEDFDTILPDLLVKEYESFLPISYHMLNNGILGDKYEIDNQDKYMIL